MPVFFMDMTNQKKPTKTKVYDQSTLVAETDSDYPPESEAAMIANDETNEDDFIEQLLQEGDSDAAFIHDFEGAASETLQDDPELATALMAYQQARHRLSERFRNRGFWPPRPFQGSSKGKGFQSKAAGKGKGSTNWANRPKKTLQERIMSSTCRLCNQRGHWKAECPLRSQGSGSQTGSTVGTSQAPTTTMIGESEIDSLPLEFINLPETLMPPLEELPVTLNLPSTIFVSFVQGLSKSFYYRGRILGKSSLGSNSINEPNMHAVTAKDRLRQQLHRMSFGTHEPVIRDRERRASLGLPVDALPVPTCPETHKSEADKSSMFAPTCFATHGTFGVLGLGASKTVVGADSVTALIEGLDPSLRNRLTRCPCDITFKFGNQGTLRSSQALVVPLGRLLLN